MECTVSNFVYSREAPFSAVFARCEMCALEERGWFAHLQALQLVQVTIATNKSRPLVPTVSHSR